MVILIIKASSPSRCMSYRPFIYNMNIYDLCGENLGSLGPPTPPHNTDDLMFRLSMICVRRSWGSLGPPTPPHYTDDLMSRLSIVGVRRTWGSLGPPSPTHYTDDLMLRLSTYSRCRENLGIT